MKSALRVAGRTAGLLTLVMLAGCVGVSTRNERQARAGLRTVSGTFRPQERKPELPTLTTNSALDEFLRFAMLNQPQVEAAYYDWAASVERITRERSLPDPRLMFETDIADMVMTLMPGLMLEAPWLGKLRLRADVASAESEARYFAFESAVLRTAFDFKRAYYRLHFLDEKIRITRQTLELVAELETIARKRQEVGKVTMQDVLRAQIEEDRLRTEIENLDDSRTPLQTELKAALGLRPGAAYGPEGIQPQQAEPPVPATFESTPLDLTAEQLLAVAFERNPRLKAMAAEVRRAVTSLDLAYKARLPDFMGGVATDVNANPTMVRPQLSITLPIWRDKIAAEIAEAQAGKRAAEARLSAEQIALGVELAEKSFMFREASRNLALFQDALLPKARLSLEVARAGYLTGEIDFFNLIDAWRTLLNFELSEVEARTQREVLLAELSLVIAGLPPARAPLLPAASGTSAARASGNVVEPNHQSAKKSHAK